MASPIPATAYQGLVRPHGSQLLEFWPPQASKNHENNDKTEAKSTSTSRSEKCVDSN